MSAKITSFSLNQQILDLLEKMSEKTGLSKSDLVRRAIEIYSEKIGVK